jgi:hypothetical protein
MYLAWRFFWMEKSNIDNGIFLPGIWIVKKADFHIPPQLSLLYNHQKNDTLEVIIPFWSFEDQTKYIFYKYLP